MNDDFELWIEIASRIPIDLDQVAVLLLIAIATSIALVTTFEYKHVVISHQEYI